MNRKSCIRTATRLALGLAALALAAAPSFAQSSYDLCATTGSVAMPDLTEVPIWGYVLGSTCSPGDATLPGPVLRPTAGDTTLTINLTNNLSEAISFFVPGLRATSTTGTAGRFTGEVAAEGSASYTFDLTGREGTFLYHSATDRIRTQVPMGLYGALVVTDGDYPFVAQDEVLVFSEIDPALNADPGGFEGAKVVDWHPQYFLINGKTSPATTIISVPTSQKTLLRFVNAGLQTFVPTFDGGLYMDVIAEDGNLSPVVYRQYGIELQAGKTIDAIINPGSDGSYALYDRALHLVNGGLVAFVQASPATGAPTAVDDPAVAGDYTIDEDTTLTTVASGSPAGVLDNDSPATGLTANLVTSTANGTLSLNLDGSFSYTPNADFNGTDQFTYLANNTSLDSNVATASITVTPVDDPPVANDDSATIPPNVAVDIDVVANDTDPDGNLDPATANTTCGTCSGPSSATAFTNNGDGTFTYTGPAGTNTFVYEVCDTTALCDTATVTITVVNNPPTANDDAASIGLNTPVMVDVVANDTDPEGNLDPTTVTVTSGPTNGATAVDTVTGAVTYTPNLDFAGTDSFVYEVCDTGAECDTATVTITVVNSVPLANDDFATATKNSAGITFSVTTNDKDLDGTIDVTSVVITTGPNTQRGGTVVENNDGTVTYVPKRGFRGTDTFQYRVNDNLGATSNVATVRINVL